MNIIEITKNIINNCPFISSFSNGIHIDYTENKNGDFGLYSVNDELVKESITGEQYRRHSFILYANHQSINDYDRINNSTFLLDFGYWLETQKGETAKVYPNRAAYITKINSANAMVFDVPTEDINDGCTYQIQIYVNYTVTNSEYVDPDDEPDDDPGTDPGENPEPDDGYPHIEVRGYEVIGADSSFTIQYVNSNGELTHVPEEAVQVSIKHTGPFYIKQGMLENFYEPLPNGNGKVAVILNLPVY